MGKISSYMRAWLIACMVGLTLSASAGPVAPIQDPLLPEVVEVLKEKETSGALKVQLDSFFASGEIKDLLGKLYNASSMQEAEDIKEQLEEQGFSFLGGKFHVFTHPTFPKYVFKIAMPFFNRTEALNASRIYYAEKLRRLIAIRKLKVKIPVKLAYFLPQPRAWPRLLHYMGKDKQPSLPRIIVVAQKLNLNGITTPLSEPLQKDLEILQQEADYIDVHGDNVVNKGNYVVILDTEKHTDDTILALHAAPALEKKSQLQQDYKIPLWSDLGIKLQRMQKDLLGFLPAIA